MDVRDSGFEYDGKLYKSLSAIAREVTGTKWNGFLFFGCADERRRPMITVDGSALRQPTCRAGAATRAIHCAIYTRKSTEEGLEQEFNSLDAQREAGEAYIASQKQRGLALLARALRRRRLHRRQHGPARPATPAGRHRGAGRSTAWWSTRWTA